MGVPSSCSTQSLQEPPSSRTLIWTACRSRATPTRSKRSGASIGGEIQRGAAPAGSLERADAIAAGAILFAAGIACSKSTAPGMYGRRESAGAAIQARAVSATRHTPVVSRIRIRQEHFGRAIRSRLQAAAQEKVSYGRLI